ncbi:MAG: hypothetical protein AUJ56_07275 [Zetaproteobacteria bacterium CG1_02_49_23]|nr:MAG: hypothetical protein AUJ56_07275 [Zetaproteobacteria bacterium CG1_02_49_23]
MANQNNTTAWADLPNANYIDIILGLLKKENTAWDAAKDAAYNAAKGAAREAVWNPAYNAARDAAYNAAYDAVRALIAWDNCGYLIKETPEDVKMLGLLGNQAAVLLYPACVALQKAKELENNVTFD